MMKIKRKKVDVEMMKEEGMKYIVVMKKKKKGGVKD